MTKKTIRGCADLAVSGKPPLFGEPLHVGRPNIADRKRFLELIDGMLDRVWLSNHGPLVEEFERQIESHLGVRNCVCVCNATAGLEIAFRALELSGEVILPSFTFVATAHAVEWMGLTPVFVDIDPLTHNIDPDAVRAAITPGTSAILGVHLWGRAAPHSALEKIAKQHGLSLIYDAAHAFGATCMGRGIGNFGHCEVLSFHATKFLNALEGGAIVTNDDELASRARKLRDFGFAGLDHVVSGGTNAKMNEASGAMGLANLGKVDDILQVNRRNHHMYCERLESCPGISVLRYDDKELSNRQYVVAEVGQEFAVDRDQLLATLRAENVLARRYFWPGCHRMSYYASNPRYAEIRLPHTEGVSDRVIVLPTGLAIGEPEIEGIGSIFAAVACGR